MAKTITPGRRSSPLTVAALSGDARGRGICRAKAMKRKCALPFVPARGTNPMPSMTSDSRPATERFRFKVGDKVFVRDVSLSGSGFRIVGPVVVQEVHSHPGRSPFYPHGEGYAFGYAGIGTEQEHEAQPGLWWDCYPGCRVWATRAEAIRARLTLEWVEAYFYG